MQDNNNFDEEKNEQQNNREYNGFLDRYKHDIKYRALIKLAGYGVFILFCIVIIIMGSSKPDEEEKVYNQQTTTHVVKTLVYKDIINGILKENKINISVIKNENSYNISEDIDNNTVLGFYENQDKITKFKIKDDILYEVSIKEEKENNNIFDGLEYQFININKLYNILISNKATKRTQDGKYVYSYSLIINDAIYNAEVIVVGDKLVEISIKGNDSIYQITF